MRQSIKFTLLLAVDQASEDGAAQVVAILSEAGATLRARGRGSLSFEMGPEAFNRFFAVAEGATRSGAKIALPEALRGLVDLVSIPPHHMLF